MFKKIELWVVALLCLLFLIILISYGAVLRHKFLGGPRFPVIQKTALFLAEIPYNLKPSILRRNISRFLDPSKDLETSNKHSNKPRFKRFIQTERDELLLLARYDGNLKRAVVEIVSLNNFSVLHTFKPNVDEINNKTDTSREEYKKLLVDHSPKRYRMIHPLLNNEGELVFESGYSPLVKIDFCSNLVWVNDEDQFHHSKDIDHEGNYWVPSRIFPSSLDKQLIGDMYGNYSDDGITKISKNGKILYQKSVTEILMENNYTSLIFGNEFPSKDPIHLNDIEPAMNDSLFWKKGDLFLSLRHRSIILHFRPNSNKLVNVIRGPFFHQHDVDIISDKEISIFNNNYLNTFKYTNALKIIEDINNSEVLIYNFEKKQFYEKFKEGLKKHPIKTQTEGLSEILNDGSMLVEEQNYGRILFFNKEGKIEWEYVNKADNNKIYYVHWSRIIKNQQLIDDIKQKIQNTKCTN